MRSQPNLESSFYIKFNASRPKLRGFAVLTLRPNASSKTSLSTLVLSKIFRDDNLRVIALVPTYTETNSTFRRRGYALKLHLALRRVLERLAFDENKAITDARPFRVTHYGDEVNRSSLGLVKNWVTGLFPV
ncbi:MAG: hypothetical protein QW343_03965 [Candidatus Norongarragalinales archaeon]